MTFMSLELQSERAPGAALQVFVSTRRMTRHDQVQIFGEAYFPAEFALIGKGNLFLTIVSADWIVVSRTAELTVF